MKSKLLIIYITSIFISPSAISASLTELDNKEVHIEMSDSVSYKVIFPGPGHLESWYSQFVIEGTLDFPNSLRIDLKSNSRTIKSYIYDKVALDSLMEKESNDQLSLSIIFHEPVKLNIDQLEGTFYFANNQNVISQKVLNYELKNEYKFPLKGNSLITAGYFNSGGHLSRATLFSIDVIGLTALYAPVIAEEETNESLAGWGSDIVSPAKGKVVFVDTGLPDQSYGQYDRESYKKPDGSYSRWGNCVVVDFGEDEYGVFMHMKNNSIIVNEGDSIKVGQKLGEMGNSGDSFGPHLHFHLQNGPTPLEYQGLPISFIDVGNQYLRKGEWVIIPN